MKERLKHKFELGWASDDEVKAIRALQAQLGIEAEAAQKSEEDLGKLIDAWIDAYQKRVCEGTNVLDGSEDYEQQGRQ